MDIDTYFARTRKFLVDPLNKETTNRAVRSQATIWIRFKRDGVEMVNLAFNSRMMTVYNLDDKNEIVRDRPLFFYRGGGGYHFWDLQTIFFRE